MGQTRRILVADDEPELVELLRVNLERQGFEVVSAGDGLEAARLATAVSPDLIVLDVMMPGLDGHEVARRLGSDPATASIPIIMLTARTDENSEFEGLNAGAWDYVKKPFSVRVLVARIESLLSRSGAQSRPGESIEHGPIRIDLDLHAAYVDDEQLTLTVTEFKLLTALVSARGKVLSRPSLISRAMGPGVTVTERTIDVHVTAIRKKLGEHAKLVQTVRGVGYRIGAPEPAIDGR